MKSWKHAEICFSENSIIIERLMNEKLHAYWKFVSVKIVL